MKRMTAIFLAGSLAALAACGTGSNPDPTPDPQPAGLLMAVTDVAAFEANIKSGLTAMTSQAVLASAGAAEDANFTGTYTQEIDVDEMDVVRYDGDHLYVAPRRFFGCCYILAEADAVAGSTSGEPVRSIRILATDPANGDAEPVSTIPLEEDVSVQGMYLDDGRMFALTGRMVYGTYGNLWADFAIWAPEKLGFRVYDVSDAANPALQVEASIDGIFVESRRIGNTVYVVSRYTPYVEGLNYYVQTSEQQARNAELLADKALDDLLPKITIGGQTQSLVDPRRCYVTADDDDGTAHSPVITSITAVPLDDPAGFSTTCYNEDAYGIYVSGSAIYLAEQRPDFDRQLDVTRVHKFALGGASIGYRGSADVDGTVWLGGQADFRMSEHRGDLRLVATQFHWNSEDFVDHHLYVLRESASGPSLEIVSMLPNDNRPGEIGKPNERLFGVRFFGDRAYAVTFEVIDPLYVIDLANPEEPFIAGELEVAGFSEFLHPVSDELLLGLGWADQGGGVKVELFDVSNIARPLSRGGTVLGGQGSYSEALYDRHAFTYQAGDGNVDRFTIPVEVFAADGSFTFLGSALYLFEIRDKATPAQSALEPVGSVAPPTTGTEPQWVERSRAYLHGDTIYYVRDEEVWASFWHTPSVVNGPF